MNRRVFLSLSAVTTTTTLLYPTESFHTHQLPKDIYQLIERVQEHLFPDGSVIPSAKEFKATVFLDGTLSHPSFDKDIKAFVIEGAESLQEREDYMFLTYDEARREKALRAFEETSKGSGWLNRIMILTLEGMLSDPLYGGNSGEFGWQALGTRGGDPRPTVRYVEL